MIETRGLTRSFGNNRVVNGLDLSVREGEVFGFLGPNGAGKTTTVRMLACLIRPTEGEAFIDGLSILDERDAMMIRKRIGLLTESPGLYDTLSAWRNLDFYARLYEVPEARRRERIEHYLRMMGLWDKRDEPVGGFSKGMKQKMAIARCLIHEPKVLFLDEPTSGLDPEASRIVREFILDLKSEGRTIFLCTHNLDEADRICDRIGIFKGRLLGVDAPSRLKAELYGRSISIQLKGITPQIVDSIRLLNYVKNVVVNGNTITMSVDSPDENNPDLLRVLVSMGAEVQFIYENRHSLEDVYFKITGAAK
ncbi:ABC-type multidrug transport system, ATPase component [Methanocella conradii HZ254]|uniref:ABC-type multidrug transport system, ATPase component n=1 Tax=Methanocella conradii (strain DSM 24694 / JCM 17849 / CGMCC 1.5162 / HZ254) TaxID=1041930 RepID=H8IAY7_METCZ|nr:ABC transporter ATP-binding protein [Methanocella conradii]AFD00997.1 ABC-type multidrug transport system, ATPase component [Methanocella conradii HZ254]MDI6897654.1 ABC transporter ATP-binding protein [Methanocella conradii]